MAHPPSNYPDIGTAGEDLVVEWLKSQEWKILHRRWRCRRGEIDIIAQKDDNLAFVEVKTRSPGNWDAGGRSAITSLKRAKLLFTAQMFIARYPQKADYSCRFDVAIVLCQQILKEVAAPTATQPVLLSSSVAGYQLTLQEYIPAAFDSST